MAHSFTWFEKFGDIIAMLPKDMQDTMKLAIIDYGAFGEFPSLPVPYDAVFMSFVDDIDNSKKMRSRSKSGNKKRWGDADDRDNGQ